MYGLNYSVLTALTGDVRSAARAGSGGDDVGHLSLPVHPRAVRTVVSTLAPSAAP
ncbi:MAG: hypothetical protein M3Y73_06330 [Actinomycetota bacterium]|nr:hypothetical protein [Actinomycetota bacterium]